MKRLRRIAGMVGAALAVLLVSGIFAPEVPAFEALLPGNGGSVDALFGAAPSRADPGAG